MWRVLVSNDLIQVGYRSNKNRFKNIPFPSQYGLALKKGGRQNDTINNLSFTLSSGCVLSPCFMVFDTHATLSEDGK